MGSWFCKKNTNKGDKKKKTLFFILGEKGDPRVNSETGFELPDPDLVYRGAY